MSNNEAEWIEKGCSVVCSKCGSTIDLNAKEVNLEKCPNPKCEAKMKNVDEAKKLIKKKLINWKKREAYARDRFCIFTEPPESEDVPAIGM